MRDAQDIADKRVVAFRIGCGVMRMHTVVEGAQADESHVGFIALQKMKQDRLRKMNTVMLLHRSRSIEEDEYFLLAAIKGKTFADLLDRQDLRSFCNGHPELALGKPLIEDRIGKRELPGINKRN